MGTPRAHGFGPLPTASQRGQLLPATGTTVTTAAQASALTLWPLALTFPPLASTYSSPPKGFLPVCMRARWEMPGRYARSNSQPVMTEWEGETLSFLAL